MTAAWDRDEALRLAERLEGTPLYEGHGEVSVLPDDAAALLRAADAEITRLRARDDAAAPPGKPIAMTYRNYRGEVGIRSIVPQWICWGATEWHPEPGWLLTAWDCSKAEVRDFALADCMFRDLSQRVEAAEKMAEALNIGVEAAESIIACPQGSLWNYGTRPSRWQEAEWAGKREAAMEILAFIAPDRYRAALAAWDATDNDKE